LRGASNSESKSTPVWKRGSKACKTDDPLTLLKMATTEKGYAAADAPVRDVRSATRKNIQKGNQPNKSVRRGNTTMTQTVNFQP
jgi:hypothetical protein